jgi:COP9 signalosome complex subunit 1
VAPSVGRTRYTRLYTIGTTSTQLCIEALRSAVAEAKRGRDLGRYDQAVTALHKVVPEDPDSKPDHEWYDRTQKAVKAETERLEQELKGYKNNLIKESIRACSQRFTESMNRYCAN